MWGFDGVLCWVLGNEEDLASEMKGMTLLARKQPVQMPRETKSRLIAGCGFPGRCVPGAGRGSSRFFC